MKTAEQVLKEELAKYFGRNFLPGEWDSMPMQNEILLAMNIFSDQSKWIHVSEKLPSLEQPVLAFMPSMKKFDGTFTKPVIHIAHLFKLIKGDRSGWIDLNIVFDKKYNLLEGGIFWAFPAIVHQNFVSHWMELPKQPLNS